MKKITCPVCKEEIELGKKFCPECGYKFEYSIVDKTEDKKEETTKTKKAQKTNTKEEKRIAIHFILYAITLTIVPSLSIRITLNELLNLGDGFINLKNFIDISNGMATLTRGIIPFSILCLNTSKKKPINIIGIILTIFGLLLNIIEIILCIVSKTTIFPSLVLSPAIILWLVVQIIYIAKKRD